MKTAGGEQVVVMAADPFFVNMTITFFTRDDDKDKNTRLEIWINKIGAVQVAYRDLGRTQYFDDPSTATYDVPPAGAPMLKSEVLGSWIQLRIAPIGHDTWKFSFAAVLRFSDQSVITRNQGPTGLSHDVKTGVYPLP